MIIMVIKYYRHAWLEYKQLTVTNVYEVRVRVYTKAFSKVVLSVAQSDIYGF